MLNLTISINRISAYITGLFNYLHKKKSVRCLYNQKAAALPDEVSPIITKKYSALHHLNGRCEISNGLLKEKEYINKKAPRPPAFKHWLNLHLFYTTDRISAQAPVKQRQVQRF
ncbi:hypothetical protein [Agriterribacter sp.]|uniref:hypothetical protein n=1 Tax=Agriterribacter sp. TaxID=2821509 RepID=UPI002BCA9D78|nr:hypothetical protein [Agriterribacter sp.]HTN08220.1 hypothetical protein [Agriterribacter sp.]